MLTDEKQVQYFKKMIMPYEKKGQKKFAILQYIRGAGNELEDKFWQEHSSSRMAFDLYSWMQEEKYPEIKDFSFEFQLPRLNSGGNGPNMDVYIETEDEIIFVESKFTEKANLNYRNPNKKGETYLSPAYYADTHGKGQMSLSKRYYGYSYAEKFAKFTEEWEEEMKRHLSWRNRGCIDWFEPKQETCHLCGIFFFLKQNPELIKGKRIRLFNIYWKMDGDEKSDMEQAFLSKAQSLIDDVVKIEKFQIKDNDFKIGAFSIQEMFDDNSLLSSHIHFPPGLSNEIKNRNGAIVGDRRRGQF